MSLKKLKCCEIYLAVFGGSEKLFAETKSVGAPNLCTDVDTFLRDAKEIILKAWQPIWA